MHRHMSSGYMTYPTGIRQNSDPSLVISEVSFRSRCRGADAAGRGGRGLSHIGMQLRESYIPFSDYFSGSA